MPEQEFRVLGVSGTCVEAKTLFLEFIFFLSPGLSETAGSLHKQGLATELSMQSQTMPIFKQIGCKTQKSSYFSESESAAKNMRQ